MKTSEDLSKEQLINDLAKLRHRINELEKTEEDKKKYEAELAQTKAMFEGLFEFAPDAIVVVSSEGLIIQINKQAERLFGYDREELLNADHDVLVPERFREKHLENRRGYMAGPHVRPMGTAGMELYGRKKDGNEFPVDIALGPLQTNNDMVVLAVVRDVTERKKAQEELRRESAQLETAHKELDAFTHSVSHDLRAPLRIIKGFSEMALEDHADGINDEVKKLLNSIHRTALRMDELIKALLDLSKAGRQEMRASNIDMGKLVKEAFDEIMLGSSEKTPRLEVGTLPSAKGDEALMRQIFANLLSNALKFTRHRETAVIEVGCQTAEKENVYFVKDNGIGFDPEYADRLFGAFQRLHDLKEFEGTGVGLSIVQRIVARHGGRVCAEGKPDEGAVFYFSLPRE